MSLFLSLLLSLAPPAQVSPVRSTPLVADVTPPAAPMYRVKVSRSVKLAADADFLWDVQPDDAISYVDEDDPNSFTFEVPEGQEVEYSVRQIAKPKGGKRETLRIKVKVGKPGPPKPPDPPPTPTDPLQAAVNAAYLTDTPLDPQQKINSARLYIAYYRKAAATILASTASTDLAMWQEVQAVESVSGISLTQLFGVRSVIKSEISRILPSPVNAQPRSLTPEIKAQIAGLYTRMANLIEGATK